LHGKRHKQIGHLDQEHSMRIYAGYGWLYIASFGMGLGAAAIALLFKPFPHTLQESSQ
jgi:hypothetical protein